jgi:MbtH protein
MPNPFENQDAQYSVLVNHEGQHSLWPSFAEVPAGWERAFGSAERVACVEYLRVNWTDMRPRGLAARTDGSAG